MLLSDPLIFVLASLYPASEVVRFLPNIPAKGLRKRLLTALPASLDVGVLPEIVGRRGGGGGGGARVSCKGETGQIYLFAA